MTEKRETIKYENLIKGLEVQSKEGYNGIVENCEDIHNVFVEYDNGGSGLHCLVEGCTESRIINGQLIEIPHYDPLYQKLS